MRGYRRLLLSFLSLTLVISLISSVFSAGVHQAAAAASDPGTFIKGADISTLQAIEDAGGKYFDNGVEKDLLDILKDHGVNYIRLRVWNNPVQAGADPNGVYYNDKTHLVALAQRVKSKGLKLLVDFHYSDFWADPGAQVKPAEWVQYTTIADLKGALYNYTADVMQTLEAVNAYPDMVQIGNEINPGMLLKNNAGDSSNASLNGTGANLVELIKEGVRAVRETTPAGADRVKIMIHVAHSWSSTDTTTNSSYTTFYDRLNNNNVDFDVIGLSYYPYWHGSYKAFKNDMNFLSAKYNKEVVIAETAHPFTLEDGDGWENIAKQTEGDTNGFPITPAGQKAFLETVMNMVATVNNGKGLGVFYWEPAWIPVPKKAGVYQAGWKVNEGNAWDNQAFFDFQGNALPSLDAFRYLPGSFPTKEIATIMPLAGVTTNVKVKPTLPASVSLVYNDGDMGSVAVTWDWNEAALDKLKQVGTFKLYGSVAGSPIQASVNITTNPSGSANLALNPGFETSSGSGSNATFASWTPTNTTGTVSAGNGNGNIHGGAKSVSYYTTKVTSFSLKQTISNLTPGKTYVLKAWSSGDSWIPAGADKLQLFADDAGTRINKDMINYAWNDWRQYSLEIVPTSTSITIGLDVTTPAGNKWGVFDDVEFYEAVSIAKWGSAKTLTASQVDPTGMSLNWSGIDDPASVTGYKVYQNGKLIASDITSTNYRVTGLSQDTSYTFKVEASYGSDIWTSTGPSVTVKTEPFMKGVDISTLQELESLNVKFYDNGVQKDLLDILKDNGVNYIRLRIWNNPGSNARYFNDKDKTIAMAQRIKAKGMRFLLDFHYSDFWADPGQQNKPAAWKDLSFTDLKKALYDYTADILNSLKAKNAYPDMVQIGNEINNGILWDTGKTPNFDNLADLLKEGIKAVHDTNPANHDTKIMLHLAEGGNNEIYENFFDNMKSRNVEYDVIGMSYYPYWHGTFDQLQHNMDDMAERYGKQVVVAEAAYPYKVSASGGLVGQPQVDIAGFPATVEGQKTYLLATMNAVSKVKNGKGAGVFYWEPAWITGPANNWANLALFDTSGNALDSLKAYQYLPGDSIPLNRVNVFASLDCTVPKHTTPTLPATVKVLYSDGSIKDEAVVWDSYDATKLGIVGSFTLNGTIANTNLRAAIKIVVVPYQNLVKNPGFETGTMSDWTVTGSNPEATSIEINAGNAHTGQAAFHYAMGNSGGDFKVLQQYTGLANGTYKLTAWVSGGGGDNKLQLYAEGFGDVKKTVNIANTGWAAWKKYTVADIVVTNGTATIGVDAQSASSVWGQIDDIEFYQVVDASEIKVSAVGGVTELNGSRTLRMVAEVTPTNATDDTVAWSVTSANGSATNVAVIDANSGVLFAKANGVVKVKATSNGSPGVSGETLITISNVAPLTLVTGSNFSSVTGGQAATQAAAPFDGNTTTYFNTGANNAYVGKDLGAGNDKQVTTVRFYPRTGFENLMAGAIIQGSNSGTNTGYDNLYTISGTPAAGWNVVSLSNNKSYRYYRLAPVNGQSGSNVAELEFYYGVSKATLVDKITTALALSEAQYTTETWATLQTALTAAIGVNANIEAAQAEVNAAATALHSAIAGLVEQETETGEPGVSKTILVAKITAAQALDSTQYTTETWATLQTALTAAVSVNTNTDATQSEVNAAAAALQTAIAGLVESEPEVGEPEVSKTALVEVITTAQALDSTKFTAETWATLLTALTAAVDANENTEAAQSEVDAAAAALQAAIAGLIRVSDNNNPLPQTPVTPVSPGTIALTSAELIPDAKGNVAVKLSSESKEVKIPLSAIRNEAIKNINLQGENVSFGIPSALFKQLEALVSKNDAAGSSISLTWSPLSPSATEQLLNQASTRMAAQVKAVGEVYEFNFSITTNNGATQLLGKFNEPMTLRLKVAAGADPNVTGVYYIGNDGKLEYVEGYFDNGELVVQVNHFSKYAALELKKTFKDVQPNHWAAQVIAALAAKQIVNGVDAASFEPNRNITRAEFTALLVHVLKLTDKGTKSFTDVPENAWYADAVALAYQAGIVNGRNSNAFDPEGLISREEMVTMLMKAYAWKHSAPIGNTTSQTPFTDTSSISSWAREYARLAHDLSLINGKGAGVFAPKALTTRAEAAQVIYNLITH
ncbi:hypothetical protein D7Z26_14315 [Cohnella endophytica]|uniref:Arabinogalactan endo-beta-1,4-galactanase n=1 Tax=Cohnella endophytica TaxID=2419778 RepID=A0A494XXW0_9BACL|nr:glycosyl hydrolase 53 family protein [Cohnella endophytica]RKP52924.1 hypothetical protein D7Z26_14315 [Cohnella endophytica]